MRRNIKEVIGCVALLLVLLMTAGCFPFLNDDIIDNGNMDNNDLLSLREIYKDHFLIGGAVSIAGWSSRSLIVIEI